MGCLDVQLIDIGGGFSGETDIDKVYTLCSRVLISFYFIDKIILKFIFRLFFNDFGQFKEILDKYNLYHN